MSLREDLLAETNGDRISAAAICTLRLMRSDPATFKQGYTFPNAILAVVDLFDLSDFERDATEAMLKGSLANFLRDLDKTVQDRKEG